MPNRLIPWTALVGAALFALACGPAADAQEASSLEAEQQAAPSFCGGFAGFPCPEGFTCVDDPRDDCDPDQGGADCAGLCRREPPGRPACTGKEPGSRYVSRDPSECAAILYTCPEGSSPFFNDCGCGCQKTDSSCDYDDPNRTWVSKDPHECATLRFFCAEGKQPFSNECGCGCEPSR